MSNDDSDPELSIARARVEPGATTKWHRVRDTVERYVILDGQGRVVFFHDRGFSPGTIEKLRAAVEAAR